MICHRYRCIFIRNPKTASVSVSKYFRRHLGGIYEEALLTLPLMRREGLAKIINLFPTYFTFAFVRNPFDRFVSAWCEKFDPQRPSTQALQYHSLREYAELATDLFAYLESESEKTRTAARCAINFFSHSEPEPDIMSHKIGPHGVPYSALRYYEKQHLAPQKEFLLDYNPDYYFGVKRLNNAPCSFIGRYENLVEDFGTLLDILGAPFSHPFLQKNVSHNRFLNNQKIHYSRYYDKETRRLVEDLYAFDLNALGYEFEDESSVSVVNPLYDIEQVKKRYKEGIKLSLAERINILLRRLITAILVFSRIMAGRFKRFLLKSLGLKKITQ